MKTLLIKQELETAVKLLRQLDSGSELSVLYFRAGKYYRLTSNVK